MKWNLTKPFYELFFIVSSLHYDKWRDKEYLSHHHQVITLFSKSGGDCTKTKKYIFY